MNRSQFPSFPPKKPLLVVAASASPSPPLGALRQSKRRVDPRSNVGSLALAATQHRTFPPVAGKATFCVLGSSKK
jgi:hypothetical protein